MPPTKLDVPSTLTPIHFGASIDWKATALQEHVQALQTRVLAEANLRHQGTIASLCNDLDEVMKARNEVQSVLRSIRAHWSAFLLPKGLR